MTTGKPSARLARTLIIFLPYCIAFALAGIILYGIKVYQDQKKAYEIRITELETNNSELLSSLEDVENQLAEIKGEDQYVTNRALEGEIKQIHDTYKSAVDRYEDLLEVKSLTSKTGKLDEDFSVALSYLSLRNYASASATLSGLSTGIADLRTSVTAAFSIPKNVVENNTPPAGGYSRQSVNSDAGTFMVDMVAGDLSSTRVIVDSASDSDCANDCPVKSLSEYVAANGGYAGINGSYFCPSTYPSCQGKTNSFDTLLMNVRKHYLNSNNNVYSTVPAVIFLGSSVRFVGKSLEWGRDTGNDGVLANQPLLVSGGGVVFGGDGDPKKGSKGPRSFVANKGNTVYIGVVHNATVAESARVLKAMGMDNGLNLDSGGSTALWHGGYKVGPGRNIPNAIVFVRR